MKQEIKFSQEARDLILEGVNLTSRVVGLTLGPSGNNVIMNVIFGPLRSTKDGISVINEIRPDNPLINAGVKLLRNASQKTATEAGDSTTSTAILGAAMCNLVNEQIKAGKSPVALRKEIEQTTAKCVEWIKNNAQQINGDVEKIRSIAYVSSNSNDLIADLIAEAFKQTGPEGVITLEDSKTDTSHIEVLGGYVLNTGWVSPYFKTDEIKNECVLIEPLILLYDKKISKANDLMQVLNYTIRDQSNPQSLLIIAANCEAEALGLLIYNRIKANMQVCVVFAPEGGMKRLDVMQDIAVFTGGQVVSDEKGSALDKENFKPEFLGLAQKVIVKQGSCVIVNGQGDQELIIQRQKQIKEMISDAPSDYEKEFLRKRAGSIGKGVAVLHIGAPTELERGDLKDLAEDSILSTRAALDEGYLPGGAVGFIRCAQSLEDSIVTKALYEPLKQLLKNGGIEDDEILNKVISGKDDYGYNAKTGEFGQLIAQGVLDAAKVIRCAIENASSVAGQFCSTECLISEIPD